MEQINLEAIIEASGEYWDEDSKERNAFLTQFPYSVRVATSYLEMDSAEQWLLEKCGAKGVRWEVYFYGKIAYDFGYAEYFFQDRVEADSFEKQIPKIYEVFSDGTKHRTNCRGDYFELA